MPPYRTTSRRQYRRDVMGVVDDPSHANLQQPSTGRQMTPGALRQNSKDVDATCGRDVRAAGPTNNLRSAGPSMSLLPPFRPCTLKPNERQLGARIGASERNAIQTAVNLVRQIARLLYCARPPEARSRARHCFESTSRKEATMSSPNDRYRK